MFPRLTLAAALMAAALIAPVAAQASCAAHPSLQDGRYVNVDRNSRTITSLDLRFVCGSVVRDIGGGLSQVVHGADPHWTVRLWGACSPRDCDWGATRGTESAGRRAVGARYDQGFARRSVTVAPDGAGFVRVTVRSTYTDGRTARSWVERMRRN
jgi:hypothetical protein